MPSYRHGLVGLLALFAPFAAPAAGLDLDHLDLDHLDVTSLVRHEAHTPHSTTGWTQRARLAPDTRLPMRIGFAHRPEAIDTAQQLLLQTHERDAHLTLDAVNELFAPDDDAVAAVRAWVASAGIAADRVALSHNRQWLAFDADVHEAETLLHTTYYSYEHDRSGVQLAACPAYHVPAALHDTIDYITPGVKLGSYGFADRVRPLVERRERQRKKRGALGRRLARRTVTQDAFVKEVIDFFEDVGEAVEDLFDVDGASADAAPDAPVKAASTTTPTNSTTPSNTTAPWVKGGCDVALTPACIRALYGIPPPDYAQTPVQGNALGVFQSLAQHYLQADLDLFLKHEAPGLPAGTHPLLRSINGGYGPTPNASVRAPGLEATLDLQVAMPLVAPQTTELFQVDDDWYGTDTSGRYPGFLNTFFDAIDGSYCTSSAYGMTGNCATDACRDPEYPNPNSNASTAYKGALMCGAYRPTNVISISYSSDEDGLPSNYLQRQCLEVMKLALQGVTVVESAGDNGVGGARGRSADPYLGCLGANRTVFAPRALSDCPYVLSVGATVLGESDTAHESAPSSFASGGGFSNVFATPAYQAHHVAAYLDRANLTFDGYTGSAYNLSSAGSPQPGPNQLFNRTGRAYPDVSAVGDNYMVVYAGRGNKVAGTSVSAPLWASILTLINEARLRAGKKTVGFVHPTLYAHPEVFNDIAHGSNPGCGSTGFPATTGWDPITGLGSPIFGKLKDLFLSLP